MKWLRPSLIAMAVLMATVALPAVAEAHHTTLTASCVDEGDGPVVRYRVQFVGFSAANAKSSVTGTVTVDGTTVRTLPPADQILVERGRRHAVGLGPGRAGASSTVTSKFKWLENTTWVDEPAKTARTGVCPDPGISIEKDGPATAYVGDQVTFTYTVTNTGNVTLSHPDVTDDKCTPWRRCRRAELVRPGRRLGLHLHHHDHRRDWATRSSTPPPRAPSGPTRRGRIPSLRRGRPHHGDPTAGHHAREVGRGVGGAGATFTYSFVATNTGQRDPRPGSSLTDSAARHARAGRPEPDRHAVRPG